MNKFEPVYVIKQTCPACGESLKYLSTLNHGAEHECSVCGARLDNAFAEIVAMLEINANNFRIGAVKIPCDTSETSFATIRVSEEYLVENMDKVIYECKSTKKSITVERDVDPTESVVMMDIEQYIRTTDILEHYEKMMDELHSEIIEEDIKV